MSLHPWWSIECDVTGCIASIGEVARHQAIDQASRRGWIVVERRRPNGRGHSRKFWLCPDHAREDRDGVGVLVG